MAAAGFPLSMTLTGGNAYAFFSGAKYYPQKNGPFDSNYGSLRAAGRALGVGGTAMGGLVGAANGVGYGLAIAGAATAGLVVGSAINCR